MVFNDMQTIIDYSYGVEKTVLKPKNTEVGTAELQYKAFKFFGPTKTIKVPYIIKMILCIMKIILIKKKLNLSKLNDMDPWKLSEEESIGKLMISQRASQPTRNIDIYPTISSDALIAANKGLYIGGAIGAIVVLVYWYLLCL